MAPEHEPGQTRGKALGEAADPAPGRDVLDVLGGRGRLRSADRAELVALGGGC